jgi:hypothetical protein
MAIQIKVETIIDALEKIGIPMQCKLTSPFLSYNEEKDKNVLIISLPKIPQYASRKEYLNKLTQTLRKSKIPAIYFAKVAGSSQGGIMFDGIKSLRIISKYTVPGLKPSDIIPSITNDWFTPEEIVANVKKYINTIKMSVVIKNQVIELLDKSISGDSMSIDISGEKVSVQAEFFEILSAIKMVIALRKNNKEIKSNILGISSKFKDMIFSKSSPLKIYIPQNASYPLIDYEISFLPRDTKTTFKISVKSKVKSKGANTVKFQDVFTDEASVEKWFETLKNQKLENIGAKTIAQAAMKFYHGSKIEKDNFPDVKSSSSYSGKIKLLFGIYALRTLLVTPATKTKVTQDITNYIKINGQTATTDEIKQLSSAINSLYKKLSTRSFSKDTPLGEIFTDPQKDKEDLYILQSLVLDNVVKKQVEKNNVKVINVVLTVERILHRFSVQRHQVKYNFFRMFYDRVLRDNKRHIAYAITTSSKSGTGKNTKTHIHFNYYSKVNWTKEYDNWIEIKTANESAMMGLDV